MRSRSCGRLISADQIALIKKLLADSGPTLQHLIGFPRSLRWSRFRPRISSKLCSCLNVPNGGRRENRRIRTAAFSRIESRDHPALPGQTRSFTNTPVTCYQAFESLLAHR